MLHLIGILLIVGLLLWGVSAVPWIDAGIKRIIYILVVVVVGLWLIARIFGVNIHSLP